MSRASWLDRRTGWGLALIALGGALWGYADGLPDLGWRWLAGRTALLLLAAAIGLLGGGLLLQAAEAAARLRRHGIPEEGDPSEHGTGQTKGVEET